MIIKYSKRSKPFGTSVSQPGWVYTLKQIIEKHIHNIPEKEITIEKLYFNI